MRKKLKNIFNLFLLLLLFLISSCSSKKPYDWVILVYMAADNSLYMNAVSDINEMEQAEFNQDKIKVVVLSDLLQMQGEDRLYEDSKIFDIHHDDDISKVTSPIIKYNGEINSGDYNTLVDFANWAYGKYPAVRHALFIWSHGNGWYSYTDKFCVDHDSSDYFDIPRGDLRNAFDNISVNIDILGLDACNMQTLEVLNELNNNAYYVVSSEYEIGSDGFPYNDILSNWGNYDLPKNISVMVAEDFFNSYLPGGSQNIYGESLHIAASDIDKMFFTKFISDLKSFLNMDIKQIREQIVEARDENTSIFDMDYSSQIDVVQFFKNLRNKLDDSCIFAQSIDKILDDADEMFVFYDSYLLGENTGFATVWFPTVYNTYKSMLEDYSKLSFYDTDWEKIIKVYFSTDVDKKIIAKNIKREK